MNCTKTVQPYSAFSGIDLELTPSVLCLINFTFFSSPYRGGSLNRDCSNSWLPTVRTRWGSVPGRPSASCLTCVQPSQSSAPWKASALPPLRVSGKPLQRRADQSSKGSCASRSKAAPVFLLAKCPDRAAGTHCSLPLWCWFSSGLQWARPGTDSQCCSSCVGGRSPRTDCVHVRWSHGERARPEAHSVHSQALRPLPGQNDGEEGKTEQRWHDTSRLVCVCMTLLNTLQKRKSPYRFHVQINCFYKKPHFLL